MLDPYRLDEWAAKVGTRPTALMEFDAWGKGVPTARLAKVRSLGLRYHVTTWEPWSGKGDTSDTFSCANIAAGRHDAYIVAHAQALASTNLWSEYLRFGHEMQGHWYPWSANPVAYVAAWRRVADLVRAHCPSARMLWSPNGNLYQDHATFMATVRPYWPGKAYVDFVAVTAINFTDRTPQQFGRRLLDMADSFGIAKIVLPEINTRWDGRVEWLRAMRDWTVANKARLQLAAVSQPEVSDGQATIPSAGNMQWRVEDDPETRPVVREWFHALA
jgi:hypothetical protein